ncbi:hypothetical protein T552_02769 [Pneumocystis carinii B80]|uniref:SH3 domain-containing protein n=1 Tax=Pneumocystis carinii (strain B80) TaxID=1408658 RepID=A0A0W4ZEF3_PNEC8|nr:hypothetical protein T552_02769 [Pneumocystis carinii B80]KTW26768.1 hypothetical protein T552_02769 [Pneumocystis carinii B80]
MKIKSNKKSLEDFYEKRQSLPSKWLQTDIFGTIYRDYAYSCNDPRFYKSPLEYDFLKDTINSCMKFSFTDDDLEIDEDLILKEEYFDSTVKNREINDMESYKVLEESEDEIYGKAVALFDFIPEHENEFALVRGQKIWISYRHEQGWLVAVDPETGDAGLVPEEYVQMYNFDDVFTDNKKQYIPIKQSEETIIENDVQKDKINDNYDSNRNSDMQDVIKNETYSLDEQYSRLTLYDKNN